MSTQPSWCCFPRSASLSKSKGSQLSYKSSGRFSKKPKPVKTTTKLAADSPQLLNFKPLTRRRLGSKTPQTKEGMAVLFIRHGETNSNAERRVQVPETPLSERGLLQAEQLAERFANDKSFEVVKIITSDYTRAVQTADAVSKALDMPVAYERLLRERNFGKLRGELNHDLQMNGIDVLGELYTPPDGESWDMFRERMELAWEVIMDESRALGELHPHEETKHEARRSKRSSKRSSKKSPEKPRKVLIVVTHGLMLREMLLKKLTRMPEHCTVNDVLYMSNTALTLVLPVAVRPVAAPAESESSSVAVEEEGKGESEVKAAADIAPTTMEYHALLLNERSHLKKAKHDPKSAVGI